MVALTDRDEELKRLQAENERLSAIASEICPHCGGRRDVGLHSQDRCLCLPVIREKNEIIGELHVKIEQLQALNETLVESLRDRDAAFSKVMNEQCPSDEHHCACVPELRRAIEVWRAEDQRQQAEIRRLRSVVSEAQVEIMQLKAVVNLGLTALIAEDRNEMQLAAHEFERTARNIIASKQNPLSRKSP